MDFILGKKTEEIIVKIIEERENPGKAREEEIKKIDEIRIKNVVIFESIKKILSEYIDIDNHKKTLIALWIMGTYLHNSFETYPYLFLNAMRGSGKTRTLKMISSMAWEGQLLASLTESVLFRSKGTLAVDEFESIGSKEKQALRELLNAGYKKGITIRRMRKVKKKNEEGNMTEGQEAESFDAYRPIVMANIWGMDEVLGDRCIQLNLEKSNSIIHTKKIEDFYSNEEIKKIRDSLVTTSVVICSVVTPQNIYKSWNNYINSKYSLPNTTPIYTTTLTPQTYTNIHYELVREKLFNKIDATNLDGRHLELYFPFFIIANFLGEEVLNEVLEIAKSQIEDKRIDENMESKDVMLFDFISRKYETHIIEGIECGVWVNMNDLTKQFREFIGDDDDKAEQWLNAKWLGRALKRLCLIINKRRLGRGMDVVINKFKAEEKMKMFHS